MTTLFIKLSRPRDSEETFRSSSQTAHQSNTPSKRFFIVFGWVRTKIEPISTALVVEASSSQPLNNFVISNFPTAKPILFLYNKISSAEVDDVKWFIAFTVTIVHFNYSALQSNKISVTWSHFPLSILVEQFECLFSCFRTNARFLFL